MTTVELDDLARLRELLNETARDPVAGIATLAEARSAAAGEQLLGRRLLEAEARWLLERASDDPKLAETAETAETALRGLRDRSWACAEPTDLEVLFELAEERAAVRVAGQRELFEGLDTRIEQRLGQVEALERLCQAADERWAAQSAGDETQSAELQVETLRSTGQMLMALGEGVSEPRMKRRIRRRGRRSLRSADDRELACRVEARLGRRGTSIMENTSFGLLALVLVLLIVEASVALTPAQTHVLHWVDALACLFFIVEFLFKLSLARHRGSWFMRYAVVDLLPAIPAALFLFPGPELTAPGNDAVMLRMLRFLRVTFIARYVQALRPLLAPLRLLLLMVRGMDSLVRRFPMLLDRNFVFFSSIADEIDPGLERSRVLFQLLRREQALCVSIPVEVRREVIRGRLQALAVRADTMPGSWAGRRPERLVQRDVSVDRACEFLWSLQPSDIGQHMSPGDVIAIDRLVRVLRMPPVRWLPIIRRFVVDPLPASAEERVIGLGHRVAAWLQGWQDKLEFFADLHGIVTGPQILDRVATAMVRASQRPAIRLLLFGGLFLLVDLLIQQPGATEPGVGEMVPPDAIEVGSAASDSGSSGLSKVLRDIVGLPLVILGSVCLVFLALGWWLKRIAGEASEAYRSTSEAHYLSMLELLKEGSESDDVAFLARRIFADDVDPGVASENLSSSLAAVHDRNFAPAQDGMQHGLPPRRRREFDRVAMLYTHFQDGAILHESDVKTTEQLLANLSMQNLRRFHLRYSRRDMKRLRGLRLDDGSMFRGPFLWFCFITESVAVETAKRITEYNRRCPPLRQRAQLDEAAEAELQSWLAKRSDPRLGRTLERLPPPDAQTRFASTEFHALHFLTRRWDDDVRQIYGEDVLAALQMDRRNMIREIFGMRPLHRLPKTARSFNAWRFYWSRLSHGRVLALPVWSLWWFLQKVGWFIGSIRQTVREVLAPQKAGERRYCGEAPFAVAMRKIHRMKAPGLMEAVRMRVSIDPTYCGAPSGWSQAEGAKGQPELERDLDFLMLLEGERATFRRQAASNRESVAQLHAMLSQLPDISGQNVDGGAFDRADGELAVTVAWLTDRDQVRSLLLAEGWVRDELPGLLGSGEEVTLTRRCCWWVRDRIVGRHLTTKWLARQGMTPSPRERAGLRAAYARDPKLREYLGAWCALPDGKSPTQAGVDALREIWVDGVRVRRDVTALRAIQSLAVLDIRNYRDLVFRLGSYEEDGESPSLARQLP